ncbi:MAG TPA: hypothetical protein VF868_06465 [Bacteroidia bacterium]|jgi:hypothetical protein
MNENSNIYNEGPDPRLNSAGNANPFRTEADYFDSFAEKMMVRVEEFEEFQAEAPILSSIPKYNPFGLPAGYFDELPAVIQERTINTAQKPTVIDWLKMIFRPNFALPVMCVLLLAFSGIFYLNKNTDVKPAFTEEMSIEDELKDIDESTLIDALASVSITDSESDPENELIKDYLLDNNLEELNLNEL